MDKVIEHAAQGALVEWGIKGEADDLIQDLWLWYLETPSTQRKMAKLSDPERIVTVKRRAHQLISGMVLEGNLSRDKAAYSVDSVKECLLGKSTNKYLYLALEEGMKLVQGRDDVLADRGQERQYAEAIRSRYEDGVVPEQGVDHVRLSRALTSLTDEINVLFLTTNKKDGPGSRTAIFPETVRETSKKKDPVGKLACRLVMSGDDPIMLHDNTFTTLREEFLS